MFYYYKIENKINNNKYIGITTTPTIRKNRHFNKLRKNEHFNPHLQSAFNKYGEQNFFFEVIEKKDYISYEEAYKHEYDLIEKYDTYNNGYNCNPGGRWTGSKGRFSKKEVFYIKSAYDYKEKSSGIIAKCFNCPHATIYNIIINRNYKPWCDEYYKLSKEEQKQYFEDFCAETNFIELCNSINSKKNSRKINKEQVFLILLNDEIKFTNWTTLRKSFGIENRGENFMRIRKSLTHKDYYEEYKKLTKEEKEKLLCLYTEMYIE